MVPKSHLEIPFKYCLKSVEYLLYFNGLFQWGENNCFLPHLNHGDSVIPQPGKCFTCVDFFRVIPQLGGSVFFQVPLDT